MKKIFSLSILGMIFMNLFTTSAKANINMNPIKVGVLIFNEEDYFLSLLKNDLKKIEDDNKNIINFIFYNGENNQELQNQQIDELMNMKVSAILINIVDINKANQVIDKVKEKDIPLIFFNREPLSLDGIKSYNKSLYVGTEACTAGNVQGKMIIDELQIKNITDRNKNKMVDYILLQGDEKDMSAQIISECVMKTLDQNGVKLKYLASEYCNWERECAKEKIKVLLENYKDDVDIVIANNDQMAIGAILALQEIGYNTKDIKNYIPVVGIDGTQEAIKLVNEGVMMGTVIQDHEAMANALYRVSMNLAKDKPALQGTQYDFDRTGVSIRVPYNGYIIRK